jgi:adenylate cyclase class 1
MTRQDYDYPAQGIRAMSLGPLRPHLFTELSRLVSAFVAARPGDAAGQARWQDAAGEISVSLLRLVENPDATEGLDICIGGLLGLGTFGQLVLIDCLERGLVRLESVLAPLDARPLPERLGFYHRVLLAPWRKCAELTELVLSRLAEADDIPLKEALAFLEAQAGELPRPAFALREALAAGPLGRAVREALAAPAGQPAAAKLIALVPILGEPERSRELARLLEGEDDSLRRAALAAMTELEAAPPPGFMKSLTRLAEEAPEPTALAALEAGLALLPARADELVAVLARRLPPDSSGGVRLASRLALAPGGLWHRLLADQPPVRRSALCRQLFACLAEADAPGLAAAIARLPENQAPASLAAAIPPSRWPPLAAADLPPPAPQNRETSAPLALSATRVEDFQARGQVLAGGRYTDVVFVGADLREARLADCRFIRCTFLACDFRGATLAGILFDDCLLEDCDCRATIWFKTRLESSRLTRCLLGRAGLADCDLDRSRLEASSLARVRLTDCRMSGTDLALVDGAGAVFARIASDGLAISEAIFGAASFEACRFSSARLSAVSFERVSACGLRTNAPLLVRLAEAGLRRAARNRRGVPVQNGKLPPGPLPAAIAAWFAERELSRALLPFLANNERRLAFGLSRMRPEQRDFVTLLPLLLQTPAVDRLLGLDAPSPACRLPGHVPDYAALSLAQSYFPALALNAPAASEVEVSALFSLGSFGTIAQSPRSDIDIWVCARLEGTPPDLKDRLEAKLKALSRWAAERFALEVWFFLMDEASIRENRFGESLGESSGSAQALMLKEEFYRTAVHLAGRLPLWWLVPAGADAATYDKWREHMARRPEGQAFIDLGFVPGIPPAEFFGASLWQIVKALKSPFKSVMKFGLLEKYTMEGGQGGGLLCERIKAALARGEREIWHVDPYVVLFLEVAGFYAAAGDEETVDLVSTCFFRKSRLVAGAAAKTLAASFEEKSAKRLLGRRLGRFRLQPRDLSSGEGADLAWHLAVSARINRYVIGAYARVHDRHKDAGTATISPTDLTMLGRKLFVTFAMRKNKVERLAFLRLRGRSMDQVTFAARGKPGQKPLYVVTAERRSPASGRLTSLELKSGPDLAWLAAWVAVNGFAQNGVRILADASLSPVASKDLAELTAALTRFFPPEATFEADLAENLKAERVTRAFFVINLTASRDEPQIREVAVITASNWGEVHCTAVNIGDPTLVAEPILLLEAATGLPCGLPPAMGFFVPDRSRCPGILLL